MKLGMAICLCMGMCSSPVAAQQALLALGTHTPLLFSDESSTAADSLPHSEISADLSETLGGADTTLYDMGLSASPEEDVCTQLTEVASAGSTSLDYAFDRAQFSAAAMKASFSHDNMVKMARNFVPGQPLPDAPDYHPLTPRQKFQAFLNNSHSAGMGVSILSDTLISHATGAYPRLNPGMRGLGERMGISAAGAETAAFIGGFVYPTLFHQDPRYFPSHQHGIMNRLAYAASRAFIGRSDDGRSVINSSVIASQFTQAALANIYVPYRNETVSGTIENALTGLSGVVEGEVLNEFWPDITEFVWRRTHSNLVRRGMEVGDPTAQQAYK